MFAGGGVAVRPSSLRSAILLAACALFLLSLLLSQPSLRLRGPAPPHPDPGNASDSAHRATMHQFSLWAMPPEGSPFYALADSAIRSLSARMKCVAFEPHVTVVGAFGADQGLDQAQAEARTQQLCRALKPYNLRVQELASGQHFFQCVLLKMEPTPEVMDANRKARSAMDMDADAVYMPHLSLIYGDLSDEEKEAVSAEFLGSAASELVNKSMSFHVSSLALYRTNPRDLTMASWERLGVYPLEG